MVIVIFGYGSAGRRHAKIIDKNFKKSKIFIYTKQKIKDYNSFSNLKKIHELKPNYVIVSSESYKHYEQLKFLEKNFKNLKILIEKPLFDKFKDLNIKNNKVYVGYNLRFHPYIKYIRNLIKKYYFYDIQFITNSYLPNWRKNIHYKKNYAIRKNTGGGVILDLSHELDFISFFFRNFKILFKQYGKKSNITYDSEDYLKLIGKSKKTNISLDLKYFSRNEIRKIFLDGKNLSVYADLKNSVLKIKNKKKLIINKKRISVDQTILDMHKAIISERKNNILCNYLEGKKLIKLIDNIKKI